MNIEWTPGQVTHGPGSLTTGASRTFRRSLLAIGCLGLAVALAAAVLDALDRLRVLDIAGTGPRLVAALGLTIGWVTAVLGLGERRRRELRRRRPAFLILIVGISVIYLGQVLGYLVTASRAGTFESWVDDVPMAFGIAFLAAGLIQLSWPPGMTRRDRFVVASDGVLAALGLAIIWMLVIIPAQQPADSEFEALFLHVDPWAQYVAVLAVLVIAATSRRTGALPIRQLILLQSAPLLFVIAAIVGDVVPTADRQSSITWSIVGYLCALVVFVGFGVSPALEAEPPGSARLRDIWSVSLPFLPLPLAALSLLWYRLQAGELPLGVVGIAFAGLLIMITVNLVMRLVLARELQEIATSRMSDQLREGTKAEWFAALVGDSRDVVTVVDRDGRIVYQTPSVRGMLGYEQGALVDRPFADLLLDHSRSDLGQLLVRASHDDGDRGPHELTLLDSRGWAHDTETVVAPLRTGGTDGFVLTTRDVTDRRRLRAELVATGARDGLTGLTNREGFLAKLREVLSRARPDTLAVAVLDLESFRDLNDGRGHDAGDEVLRAVAAALDRLPDSARSVSRTGGDEFGILITEEEGAEPEVGDIDRELRGALASVLLADGSRVRVTFALGYTVFDGRDDSAVDLMEKADLALAAARTAQTRAVVRFEPTMRAALVARLRAEADLRDALDSDRLVVHYQPVVELRSGRIESVEALARLRGADGEMISPAEFIPRAEDLGLIHRLGQKVLHTALHDSALMAAEFGREIPVAVNVSSHQLDGQLLSTVTEALASTHSPASRLTLELTESVLAENTDAARGSLEQVRRLGCSVALDDFGTGYSSLAYLASLPVDLVKIDASFVGNLGSSSASFALVRTIVQLAQTLGLTTVAEGVESIEQADILRGMSCPRAQGYLYAAPLSITDLLLTVQLGEGVLPLVKR